VETRAGTLVGMGDFNHVGGWGGGEERILLLKITRRGQGTSGIGGRGVQFSNRRTFRSVGKRVRV